MAASSVGQIGLDLVVNKNNFEQQMQGIQGLAMKAGKALAAAFAVKKLIDFSVQSVKLAQVQQEAEKKLETVMRQRMHATNAAIQSVKDFTSAQQALGVVGDETQMAGAQQLSTFLKSKDALETLIPAMNNLAVQQSGVNVSAGDMVNIGNLMGKVMQGQTAALTRVGITFTEAEEKAIKYGTEEERAAMLAKVITNNVGEMNAAIASTPAGQIQQLKNNFGDLMEVIGSGIQTAIMPVIRVLNVLVSKLLTAANAVKAFFALFGGGKGGGVSVKAMTAGTDAVAKSADEASGALGGTGGAAKKAAKDIKTATTGIDELNILSPDKDSGGEGGSGGGAGGGGDYTADDFDMGEIDEGSAQVDSRIQGIIDRINELKGLFVSGFWQGFGDTAVFDEIAKHVDGIKKSIKDIADDPALKKAAHDWADSFAYNFGRVSGSFGSIGTTMALNLVGGIDLYLKQNKKLIQDQLVKLFELDSRKSKITGDFYESLADVFTVFRSPQAQQITADLLAILGNTALQAAVLWSSLGADLQEAMCRPFIENTEGIKGVLNGLLEQIGIVTGSTKKTIEQFMTDLQAMYDAHVAPFIQSVGDGLSEIVKVVLDAYEQHIKPVIAKVGPDIQAFQEQYLSPLLQKATELLGSLFDLLKALWENVLVPFISWLIQFLAPIVASVIEGTWNRIKVFFEGAAQVISDIIDALKGLIDFLTGVFTGDWDLAWSGIKAFLSGIWNAMRDLVIACLNYMKARVDAVLNTIKTIFETVWNAIKSFLEKLWESIKSTLTETWNNIKAKADEIFSSLRDKLSEIWDSVRTTIEEKWNSIKEWFDEIWGKIKDVFKPEEMLKVGEDIMNKLWDGMKGIWDSITKWLRGCADFVSGVWNTIVDGAKSMFEDARDEAEERDSDDSDDRGDGSGGGGSYGKFATGGFPEDGWFRASHGEIMGKFDNGQSVVANNGQITSGISRAVQQGMASVMAPVVSAMKSAAVPPPLTAVAASGGAGARGRSPEPERDGERYAFEGEQGDSERVVAALETIAELIRKMDLTVSLDARDVRKSLVELDERRGYTLRTT